MNTGRTLISLAALSLSIALIACGGDDETTPSGTTAGTASTGSGSGACNTDPFACAAGMTCWVSGTQASPTFECLDSGDGQVGDDCMNYIGTPTCGDAMTCFSVSGYPNVCTPYCDPQDAAHACPDDANCLQIQLQGSNAVYFACEPSKDTTSATTATGTGGAGGDGSGTGGAGGA